MNGTRLLGGLMAGIMLVSPVAAQDKSAKPDRLLRILPVGEMPPYREKIVNGVRQEQPPPPGSVPPRKVISMVGGKPNGNPISLYLDRLSASVPVRAGAMLLHESAGVAPNPKAWAKVSVPSRTTHALTIFWSDRQEKWKKARSLTLRDDVTSFPAGTVRFVNVSPLAAMIEFRGKKVSLPPGKLYTLKSGVLNQESLVIRMKDERGKLRPIIQSGLSLRRTERSTIVVYRADGAKPRRNGKVKILTEPAKLPAPPKSTN